VRIRALAELTWPEVQDCIDRGRVVVLPVGSIEQHGPHLPLATDAMLAASLAAAVAERTDAVVAPALQYGYRSRPLSGGGEGFAGTTSLDGRTFTLVADGVLSALLRQGFRRAAVLNWHYENAAFVYEAVACAVERNAGDAPRVLVAEIPFGDLPDVVMQRLFGDEFPGWDVEHAAILETSLMLHLHPELVLADRAVDDQSERHPWYDVVPAPADFVPASGVLWKATRADREAGREAWEAIVLGVTAAIEREL
jgi:creatinine amidohydrolase